MNKVLDLHSDKELKICCFYVTTLQLAQRHSWNVPESRPSFAVKDDSYQKTNT